ncbi:MAG: FeoB-associated Cys-rich membrane protein [Firmicutes bacterium]|nr:FeoB-associated Cys-rich membrane protein [Bacillota bacterium]
MPTIIAIFVIVGTLTLAGRYIYREKKRGTKCIGCPLADTCNKK